MHHCGTSGHHKGQIKARLGLCVQDRGQLPAPASAARQAGRGDPLLSEEKNRKAILLPLICTIKLPCYSSPPFLFGSRIRSSGWPIKSRKDVSIDERSAQAEKAQSGATTSSSSHPTADISPCPATTTEACVPVFGPTPREFLTRIRQPSPGSPKNKTPRSVATRHRPRC